MKLRLINYFCILVIMSMFVLMITLVSKGKYNGLVSIIITTIFFIALIGNIILTILNYRNNQTK